MDFNRRAFIAGAAAVTALVALPTVLATKAKATAAKSGKTMLLVCGRYDRACAIHTAMGKPSNVVPSGIGSALCGMQADLIVADDFYPLKGDKRKLDWWHQSVLTRLAVDGEVASFDTYDMQAFDFGNQHGLPSTWTTPKGRGRFRTATRIIKRYEDITVRDIIQTEAAQILWFAKKYHGFVPVFRSRK